MGNFHFYEPGGWERFFVTLFLESLHSSSSSFFSVLESNCSQLETVDTH